MIKAYSWLCFLTIFYVIRLLAIVHSDSIPLVAVDIGVLMTIFESQWLLGYVDVSCLFHVVGWSIHLSVGQRLPNLL